MNVQGSRSARRVRPAAIALVIAAPTPSREGHRRIELVGVLLLIAAMLAACHGPGDGRRVPQTGQSLPMRTAVVLPSATLVPSATATARPTRGPDYAATLVAIAAPADAPGEATARSSRAPDAHVRMPQPGSSAPPGRSRSGSRASSLPVVRTGDLPTATLALGGAGPAYARIRQAIEAGEWPPAAWVSLPQLLGSIDYGYEPPPPGAEWPFNVFVETAESPWTRGRRLVRIAVKAREVITRDADAPTPIVAEDVRLAITFNPARVAGHRLVGGAGSRGVVPGHGGSAATFDLRAGAAVTALFEIVPATDTGTADAEMLWVEVDLARPGVGVSESVVSPGYDTGLLLQQVSDDVRLATAMATFGLLMSRSAGAGEVGWAELLDLARSVHGPDPHGERAAFVQLVARAAALDGVAR